jgi:NTE family protein
MSTTVKTALVLAGGGVAGIAWEIGVLQGIHDADLGLYASLVAADVVVGTSAGSAVAAQITSSATIADLYSAQLSETTSEIVLDVDIGDLVAQLEIAGAGATSAQDARRRIGSIALAARTVPEQVRRDAISARLPESTWPARDLLLPAVDADSGEARIFTRASGVSLVDAVAASCAVPGVWPPVTIGANRYIDGGIRSATNADLAAGCDRVLILTPSMPDAPFPWGSLHDEIEALGQADVRVVYADGASIAAFGTNPLSPTTRGPSAKAGRTIGRSRARELLQFWS